jgi:hypothetical protein
MTWRGQDLDASGEQLKDFERARERASELRELVSKAGWPVGTVEPAAGLLLALDAYTAWLAEFTFSLCRGSSRDRPCGSSSRSSLF